jgi:hypothetical protein
MTTIPVDLHRELAKSNKALPAPEPWTWREVLAVPMIGVAIFVILFAFMYAIGSMQ